MSKKNNVVKKGIRAVACMTARSSINSACVAFIYQPKVPDELRAFVRKGKRNTKTDE